MTKITTPSLAEIYIDSRQPQASPKSCWLGAMAATLRAVCRTYEQSHCFNTTELEILNKVLHPEENRTLGVKDLEKLYPKGQTIDTWPGIASRVFKYYLPNHPVTFKAVHADSPSFEQEFKEEFKKPRRFFVINVAQEDLIGKGGGHFCPIAPYVRSPLTNRTKPDPAQFLKATHLMSKTPEVTVIDPDTDPKCFRPGIDSYWYHRSFKVITTAMHTRKTEKLPWRGYVSLHLHTEKDPLLAGGERLS